MADSSPEGTEQVTLGGDVRTRLVNQRDTDSYDIDIGRANGGTSHINNTAVGEPGWLGNPYSASDYSREGAIRRYRGDFYDRLEDDAFERAVKDLRGQTLACWCVPQPCHGDVLVEYLDG